MRAARLYLLIFASSAVELAYQTLWMRRFTLVLGATATAGAISLAAIFLGLGVGGAVGGARASKNPHPRRLFARLELGMALGAALLEPILGLYDRLAPGLYPTLVASPAASFALQASLCFVAAGLPSFFRGGLLPVAGQALTLPRGASRPAGLRGLYAAIPGGTFLGTMLVPTVCSPTWAPPCGGRPCWLKKRTGRLREGWHGVPWHSSPKSSKSRSRGE